MAADCLFLSVEQVLYIHEELLRRYGGSTLPGHRGEGEGVAAAVFAVENSYYEEIFELAAAYAVYIVMGHVFGDGNKRAASAAALTFLAVNQIDLSVRSHELRDIMINVQKRAESSPPAPTSELIAWLAAWLRSHHEI